MTVQEFNTVAQGELVYEGRVAGAKFQTWSQSHIADLRLGLSDIEVRSVPVPQDPNGVALFFGAYMVGWVPREWTYTVRNAWAAGATLTAEILPTMEVCPNPIPILGRRFLETLNVRICKTAVQDPGAPSPPSKQTPGRAKRRRYKAEPTTGFFLSRKPRRILLDLQAPVSGYSQS